MHTQNGTEGFRPQMGGHLGDGILDSPRLGRLGALPHHMPLLRVLDPLPGQNAWVSSFAFVSTRPITGPGPAVGEYRDWKRLPAGAMQESRLSQHFRFARRLLCSHAAHALPTRCVSETRAFLLPGYQIRQARPFGDSHIDSSHTSSSSPRHTHHPGPQKACPSPLATLCYIPFRCAPLASKPNRPESE